MEYNGNITFLINEEGAELDIQDEISREHVIKIRLTASDLCAIMGRHAYHPCNIEYGNLERVGKKLVVDQLVFEVNKWFYNYRKEEDLAELNELADKACPEGWIADRYYGSQNSFFTVGEKHYARVTIRKWVSPDGDWSEQCNQN